MANIGYSEARKIASIIKKMDNNMISAGRMELWNKLVDGGYLLQPRTYRPMTIENYKKMYGYVALPEEAKNKLKKVM